MRPSLFLARSRRTTAALEPLRRPFAPPPARAQFAPPLRTLLPTAALLAPRPALGLGASFARAPRVRFASTVGRVGGGSRAARDLAKAAAHLRALTAGMRRDQVLVRRELKLAGEMYRDHSTYATICFDLMRRDFTQTLVLQMACSALAVIQGIITLLDRQKPEDENATESKYTEEEEEEEWECGFCLYMKAGGCKDAFVAWEECVDAARKVGADMVERCYEATSNLRKCMDAHADYYEPVLRAEQAVIERAEAAAKDDKGGEPAAPDAEKKEEALPQQQAAAPSPPSAGEGN